MGVFEIVPTFETFTNINLSGGQTSPNKMKLKDLLHAIAFKHTMYNFMQLVILNR